MATLLFTFFSYGVIKDYITSKAELNKSKIVVDRLYFNTYLEKRILKSDLTHKCFDIGIKGQPYFIRLTDNSHSDKWEEIQEKYSPGDTIEILYANRLLQDTVLYNPNELIINHQIIISITETRRMNFWAMVLVTSMTLLFGFVTYIAYQTYREEFLDGDKILFNNSKWTLIGLWLKE